MGPAREHSPERSPRSRQGTGLWTLKCIRRGVLRHDPSEPVPLAAAAGPAEVRCESCEPPTAAKTAACIGRERLGEQRHARLRQDGCPIDRDAPSLPRFM